MPKQRQYPRYMLWFPVKLGTANDEHPIGVTHNASQGGVLIVSNTTLREGEVVDVTFRVSPLDPEDHTVSARIVRIEPNTDDPDGLWPHRMALEFAEPVANLESLFRDAAEELPLPVVHEK